MFHAGIRSGDNQPELSSETPHIGIAFGGIDLVEVLHFRAIVNHARRRQGGHGWDIHIGDDDRLPGQLANDRLRSPVGGFLLVWHRVITILNRQPALKGS